VALVAAYGVAALGLGAVQGVPLPALLSGASFWQRLPVILQGAVLGAVVVLPLGIIALVVSAGLRRPAGGSLATEATKAVVVLTSIAIVLASAPFRGARETHLPSVVAAPSPREALLLAARSATRMSPSEIQTALDNSFQAIEDGERQVSRDRWDVVDVANHLGNDPMKTFRWVRYRTYWVPYHGMLRGATGVLLDRRGNSFDRAELLAMLLRNESRRNVRLAHGTLSREQAAQLLPVLLHERESGLSTSRAATQSDPWGPIAARYHFDEATLRASIVAQRTAQARLRGELRARTFDQCRRLAVLVGPPDKAVGHAQLESAVAALQDHWWVQFKDGDSWRDLDLADPTGSAITTADRTIDPEDVPVGDRHLVTVRVIAEQWINGTVRERVALEHTLRPADLIGTPITLQLTAGTWPKDFPGPSGDYKQALRAVALAQNEWTPALQVGTNHVTQTAITSSGDLTMASGAADTLKMAQGTAKGLGAALDGAFSADTAPSKPGAPPSAPGAFLTATWIEYEVQSPGEAPEKVRRAVFDALGPAARAKSPVPSPNLDESARLRRSLAMMMSTDVLPSVCRLPSEFVTHLAAQGVLGNRAALKSVFMGEIPDDYGHAQELFSRLKPMPGPIYGLGVARFDWSPVASFVFVDRPNLLTRHTFFEPVGSRFVLRQATDIVTNDVGVTLDAAHPFAVRLTQGVLDTNAEARLESSRPDPTNAAWATDAAGSWSAISAGQDARSAIQLDEDTLQQVTSDLKAGYTVVAPRRPIQVSDRQFSGWWRIDPRSGQTLGMSSRGWGQSMVEYAVLILGAAATAYFMSYIFCRIYGGSEDGGGPSACVSGPTEPRNALADLVAPPVFAAGVVPCIWSSLESVLLFFAGEAMGAGGGGPGGGEPGGGGGEGEPGGSGGGGGGGNGGGGEPQGGGGSGGGGGPQGGGGGGGPQGGGGGGGGEPGGNNGSYAQQWGNDAMRAADLEAAKAAANGDSEGFIHAWRQMAQNDPNYPASWKAQLGSEDGITGVGPRPAPMLWDAMEHDMGPIGDYGSSGSSSGSSGSGSSGSGSGSGQSPMATTGSGPGQSPLATTGGANGTSPYAATQPVGQSGQTLPLLQCPPPCTSPLATTQAGLGNMTTVMGQH
jgi:hypothetical protein